MIGALRLVPNPVWRGLTAPTIPVIVQLAVPATAPLPRVRIVSSAPPRPRDPRNAQWATLARAFHADVTAERAQRAREREAGTAAKQRATEATTRAFRDESDRNRRRRWLEQAAQGPQTTTRRRTSA